MSTRSIVVDVNCGVSRVSTTSCNTQYTLRRWKKNGLAKLLWHSTWASSMYLKSEQKGKNRKDSILILGALGGKIHKTVTAKIFQGTF